VKALSGYAASSAEAALKARRFGVRVCWIQLSRPVHIGGVSRYIERLF
jgi:hypothetical protein